MSTTLPIMERIRRSLPISEEIWRFSEKGLKPEGKHKDYDDLATFESHVREMLANGTYTLDRHIAPEWADPKRYFGNMAV